MSRTIRRVVVVLVMLSTTGVVLALVDGAPDPGIAIRCYAAVIGTLAVISATSWLRLSRRAFSGATGDRSGRESEINTTGPMATAWLELERALRFGATTMGDYRLLVQPRLSELASRRLARHGCSLADAEAAEAALGPEFRLIDPRVAMPTDRLAAGIPVAEIERFVTALEEL